jgi:hypothetical protein
VNKHQTPTQISLATIASCPSLIRDFGSRNFVIPNVEFLGPLLPKPEMPIHRNVWPRPSPQPYCISRFRESRNKEPLPLVFESAEMPNPDAFSKDWLPYGTFRRFGVSDFTSSRILMQGFRLSNLRNPEIVNEVLTPPGD